MFICIFGFITGWGLTRQVPEGGVTDCLSWLHPWLGPSGGCSGDRQL